MTPTGYVPKYAYDPGGGSRTALLCLHQSSPDETYEVEAAAGVAEGCCRGRMEGSACGAATGMPPVVPNDSLERAPSGRGFAVDRNDDKPVGWRGGSTGCDS